MKTTKEKSLSEMAYEAYQRLKKNPDFLLFLGEVVINGVTLTSTDLSGKVTSEGIKIGIIKN